MNNTNNLIDPMLKKMKFGVIFGLSISIFGTMLNYAVTLYQLNANHNIAALISFICGCICIWSFANVMRNYGNYKDIVKKSSLSYMKENGYKIFEVTFKILETQEMFKFKEYGHSEDEIKNYWVDYFSKEENKKNQKYEFIDVKYFSEI